MEGHLGIRIDIRRYAEALQDQNVLLLTANSVEKEALNGILQSRREATTGFDTLGCSIGRIGGRFVLHITGDIGFSSKLSLGRQVTELFATDSRNPQPALLILAGFGWGNPSLTLPNSVMAATSVCMLNN